MSFPDGEVFKTSDEIPDDEIVYLDARGMGFTSVHAVETTKGDIEECLENLRELYYLPNPTKFRKATKRLRKNLMRQDKKLCSIQDYKYGGEIVNNDAQIELNDGIVFLHCADVVAGSEEYIHLVPEGVFVPPTVH